jgi:mRNA-degrading endonuclease RelE of RelBE toxin-antitoxin system
MDRRKIAWRDQAKAQLRAVDQPTALRLLRAVDQPTALRLLRALAHFAATGEGDVKRLQDIEPPEFRLRVGDYRLRFHDPGHTLYITAFKHRREAYR